MSALVKCKVLLLDLASLLNYFKENFELLFCHPCSTVHQGSVPIVGPVEHFDLRVGHLGKEVAEVS